MTAVLVGAVALGSIFWPPFPIPGWIASALTVGPVEHLWYSLPETQRQTWLYYVGVTAASGVYPALLALAFWLWSRPLRRGVMIPWSRGVLVIALAGLLSLVWYVVGWRWGIQYQGRSTVVACLLISLLWLAITTACIRFSSIHSSWWGNLVAHFLLFTWMVTFAFPWLGEMP